VQPSASPCRLHGTSALCRPSRKGKGLSLARAVEQPCLYQVCPSAGHIRWALENGRDGNKGVEDWISRWGVEGLYSARAMQL